MRRLIAGLVMLVSLAGCNIKVQGNKYTLYDNPRNPNSRGQVVSKEGKHYSWEKNRIDGKINWDIIEYRTGATNRGKIYRMYEVRSVKKKGSDVYEVRTRIFGPNREDLGTLDSIHRELLRNCLVTGRMDLKGKL